MCGRGGGTGRSAGRRLARTFPGLVALMLWLGGCGADPPARPALSVGVSARWNWSPATSQGFGYTIAVLLLQLPPPGASACVTLPASMRLSVNDQQVDAAFDDSGCLDTPVVLGPVLQVGPITVDVEENGRSVSHGEFENLAPGAGATLTVPADGLVRAGDEIVVAPPPELPTGELDLSFGFFYPLEEDVWFSTGVLSPEQTTRLADGIHAKVPAFTGRAAVVFRGKPYVPDPKFSCSGFAVCTATADNTLGPVFVSGEP
jgi:hypothetical protein